MTTFGAIPSDIALTRSIDFDATEIGKGSTAPTDVVVGTSPEVSALLFDATAETGMVLASLLPEMDLNINFTVHFLWALVNTEVNEDQLDLTLDYIVFQENVTGAGLTKTSTQILATQQVTTNGGLAIGDVYDLDVTLVFDDATNPLNVTDAAGIVIEFHLTNLTEIAAIHLLDVDIEYTALF